MFKCNTHTFVMLYAFMFCQTSIHGEEREGSVPQPTAERDSQLALPGLILSIILAAGTMVAVLYDDCD